MHKLNRIEKCLYLITFLLIEPYPLRNPYSNEEFCNNLLKNISRQILKFLLKYLFLQNTSLHNPYIYEDNKCIIL